MARMPRMARIRPRWLIALIVTPVLLAVIAVTVLSYRQALASGATITLSPTSGAPGVTVQVSGSGFGRREGVTVTFDGTQVAATSASKTGTIATSFAVPQAAAAGNHTVVARGANTGRSASATFQVVVPTAANWPQFGYAAQGGRANPAEATLSTANVAQLTQDWSVSLSGGGSIPGGAVYNGVVYVDDNAGIAALNQSTGAQLWFSSTMGGGDVISSYITPAVDNGMVFAAGGDNRVYAFDAQTGATRWIFTPNAQMLSSQTVANGNVYVTCRDGHAYALNETSGAVVWSFLTGDGYGSDMTPAVANGAVYFVDEDGVAYAVNASTGVLLWKTTIGTGGEGINAAAVDGGTVFLASGAPYPSTQGEVSALDATTGVTKWTAFTPFYGTNGVAVASGAVYVSTISNGVYAFDEATGAAKWQVSVAMAWSAPAVANGVVYVGAGTAYVYAFDAATGATLATVGNCGNQPYSSPIVANGVVYMGCASTFAAFHLPGTTP